MFRRDVRFHGFDMTRLERDYRRLCETEKAILTNVSIHKGHFHLHFEKGFVVAGGSPSDRRNLLHVRAQIRRLHRS